MEAGEAFFRPPGAGRAWRLTRRELKRNMWRLPARFKAVYAEADAVATLRAVHQMRPQIEAQDLGRAYGLEMNLVPVVQRMRARGIRVDTALAAKKRDAFLAKRDELLAEMGRRLPPEFSRGGITMENLRTNKWMEPVFKDQGIRYPRTEKTGQASFSKDWMEKHEHWLPRACVEIDKYEMAANKFLQGFVIDYAHRGRLHAEFHQYKSDDGGTVSYRFAVSDPPLQQMPSPDIDPEIGLAVRECFVADEGAVWGCLDASQQEYKLTAHYAAACKVIGGDAAVEAYRRDPKLDYHKFVAGLTGLTRAKAKIQNFALLYGQGVKATAASLGISIEEAQELRSTVEKKAPFGPALADFVKRQAAARGYIRLIDGARCRFEEWECAFLENDERRRGYSEKWPMAPCSHEEAIKRTKTPGHPWEGKRLKRAYVNKAMNRLIQGSAARQIKRGMWDCAMAGLIPILQVHDELNFSEESPEVIAPAKDLMLSGFDILIPMTADGGCGPNWAAAKSK
jgi:DNA polymerase I-like protein with 3'-5' exonuclease and polymerase domains